MGNTHEPICEQEEMCCACVYTDEWIFTLHKLYSIHPKLSEESGVIRYLFILKNLIKALLKSAATALVLHVSHELTLCKQIVRRRVDFNEKFSLASRFEPAIFQPRFLFPLQPILPFKIKPFALLHTIEPSQEASTLGTTLQLLPASCLELHHSLYTLKEWTSICLAKISCSRAGLRF